MPNTQLIESPWSEVTSLTTGYAVGVKPKKTILGKFPVVTGVTTDIHPFAVGNDIYAVYFNETEKLSIGKYNTTNGTLDNYSSSTIGFDIIAFTTYEKNVYIVMGDYAHLKFITFNIDTKVWTNLTVNPTICLFNSYSVNLVVRPIIVNNVVTNEEIYVAGISKDMSGALGDNPFMVKYDKNLATWSSVSFPGIIPENNPGFNGPCAYPMPQLVRYNDGIFWYGGQKDAILWYYNFSNGSFTNKNSSITYTTENDFMVNLFSTGTTLIGLFESYLPPDYFDINYRYLKEYDIVSDTWKDLTGIPSINEPNLYFTNIDRTLYGINFNYGIMFAPSLSALSVGTMATTNIPSPDTHFISTLKTAADGFTYYYYLSLSPEGNYICKSAIYNDDFTTNNVEKIKITFPGTIQVYWAYGATFYNGYLYLMGGNEYAKYTLPASNKLFKINIDTGQAVIEDETGLSCYLTSMIGLNDKLYFVGGNEKNSGSISDDTGYRPLRYYDLISKTWTLLPISQLSKRIYTNLIVKDNVIYALNGSAEGTGLDSMYCAKWLYKWDTTTNIETQLNLVPRQGDYGNLDLFKKDGTIYGTMRSPLYEGNSYKFYNYDEVTDTFTLDKEYPVSNFTTSHSHNNVKDAFFLDENFLIFGELSQSTNTLGLPIEYNLLRIPYTGTDCYYLFGDYFAEFVTITVNKPFCTVPNEDVVELEYEIDPGFDLAGDIEFTYSLSDLNNSSTQFISQPNALLQDGPMPSGIMTFKVRVRGENTLWSEYSQATYTHPEIPLPPP